MLSHLLIVVAIGTVLRWIWKSSILERSHFEAGRTLFPPTRAIRILMIVLGVAFTSLFLWSWFDARKPDERWVPYLFLGLLAVDLCIDPGVLSIEVDGVGSRSWLWPDKKIRWEDISSLHYNTGSKQFIVRAKDGRSIAHAGFNADQAQFIQEIHKHTRLPMKVSKPGTWKSETFDVPYEEQIDGHEQVDSEEEIAG